MTIIKINESKSTIFNLYIVKTNENIDFIKKKITSVVTKKIIIEFEGLYRTIEAKQAINKFSSKTMRNLPTNTNYIFITQEQKNKKPKNMQHYSDYDLSLLFKGDVKTVAATLGRSEYAIHKKKERLREKNPVLYQKLLEEGKNIITKPNNTINNIPVLVEKKSKKRFTEAEDEIIITYENCLSKAETILERDSKSISMRHYRLRLDVDYYNSLKQKIENNKKQSVKDKSIHVAATLTPAIFHTPTPLPVASIEKNNIIDNNGLEFAFNGIKIIFKNKPKSINIENNNCLIVE